MSEIETVDPRRRLRELLAVPERDRSDAVWDEIIELEIRMAPGNSTPQNRPEHGRRPEQKPQQGRRPDQKPQQGQRQQDSQNPAATKPAKHFSKRPRRPPNPQQG